MAVSSACGHLIPSGCVPYTGKDLVFLTGTNQIACNSSIDDVIDKISISIKALQDGTNTTTHDVGCLQITGTVTAGKIEQAQTDKICALSAQFENITDRINDLNLANEPIQIDLGCLAQAGASCAVASNTYTLISILNIFRAEICAIKTQLGI